MKQRILYEYKNGRRTERKMQKLPYDLVLTKAECHVALPRSFVDYIFQSRVAKDFLEWLKKTRIPDETYFPTLNNSPQLNIPGMYTGTFTTSYKIFIYLLYLFICLFIYLNFAR